MCAHAHAHTHMRARMRAHTHTHPHKAHHLPSHRQRGFFCHSGFKGPLWPEECGKLSAWPPNHPLTSASEKVAMMGGLAELFICPWRENDISHLPDKLYRAAPSPESILGV